MRALNESLKVWKRIFSDKKYFFLVILIAAIFYFISGFFLNVNNIPAAYSLFGFFGAVKFIFISSILFHTALESLNFYTIIFLSLLVGFLFSILIYRFNLVDKKDREKIGFISGVGIFLGAAAPGCVACGIGFFSFLGISSILAVLPFGGKEIVFLSIAIVGFSVVNISRKLYNPVCKVNYMSKMKGGNNERK